MPPFERLVPMQVIPVIDIKDGHAVHARQGRRDSYQPLHTRFAASTAPAAIVAGLVAALPIEAVYIADLDAIMRGAPNLATVQAIADAMPDLEILIDGGFSPAQGFEAYLARDNIGIVLASEALSSLAAYRALAARVPPARLLLSLDRGRDGPLGCQALFDAPDSWPPRVIHMTLARVGADNGPDVAGLTALRRQAGPARRVIAAGGVRGLSDLEHLARIGIDAALVGTALHDGRLDRDALERAAL